MRFFMRGIRQVVGTLGRSDIRAEPPSQEGRVQITFHDLRATGITWCALRGDSMISIRDRAGHTDVEQTNDYVRRASHAGNVSAPFPSLDALYPSAATGPAIHITRETEGDLNCLRATGTYEVEPRGSNPSQRHRAREIPTKTSRCSA